MKSGSNKLSPGKHWEQHFVHFQVNRVCMMSQCAVIDPHCFYWDTLIRYIYASLVRNVSVSLFHVSIEHGQSNCIVHRLQR